jgi:hypothetical protein
MMPGLAMPRISSGSYSRATLRARARQSSPKRGQSICLQAADQLLALLVGQIGQPLADLGDEGGDLGVGFEADGGLVHRVSP